MVLFEFFVSCMMLIIVYWLLIVCVVDWIIVVEDGCVVEIGMYDELMVVEGVYKKLVEL